MLTGRLGAGSPVTGTRGASEPQVGQLFADRYEIQSVLGRGGMGIVYKAQDRDLDDVVAIKTLRSEALSADPTLLDRFKQEIRLARKITHANILRTHDLGETNGLRYLSMEFVKGITLKQMVEQDQLIPTPVALRVAKQICAGLAAAHEVGVIHRDIKPQNIIIEPTGGLKVMDFGIARLTQDRGMTSTGTVVGTPDYIVARAGPRPEPRFPLRHLLDRRRSLRAFHRDAPLRGGQPARRRPEARAGEAAAAAGEESEDRPEACGYHLEMHAEGPRRPLPERQPAYEALTRGTA